MISQVYILFLAHLAVYWNWSGEICLVHLSLAGAIDNTYDMDHIIIIKLTQPNLVLGKHGALINM